MNLVKTLYSNMLKDEESLTGFLLRAELLFAADESNNVLRKIDGEVSLRSFPRLQGGIETKNIERLLANNTIYPLLKYTAEYSFKSELIRLCDQETTFLHNGTFMRKVFHWKKVLYCPKCFIEQIKHHGFCWLLREWQAPLVTACHVHNIKLCRVFCDCSIRNVSNISFIVGLFTGRCPSCNQKTWPNKYLRATLTERSTAKWMSELLKYPPIQLSRAVHLSLIMDMVEMSGVRSLSHENQLGLFFKRSFKQQKSFDWRLLYNQQQVSLKTFNLPVDPKVFYSLVINSFSSASDFYAHIKTCGCVGYLNVKEHDFQLGSSRQLANVEEELIQDVEPENMNEDWVRLIV